MKKLEKYWISQFFQLTLQKISYQLSDDSGQLCHATSGIEPSSHVADEPSATPFGLSVFCFDVVPSLAQAESCTNPSKK